MNLDRYGFPIPPPRIPPMSGEEIISDLNKKFFLGLYVYECGTVICKVFYHDATGALMCESRSDFNKRFPGKWLINGKEQRIGPFWLHHPRRRTDHQCEYWFNGRIAVIP